MIVTRGRFEQGMTYAAYKEQMTRNQERFAANEEQVVIVPEDLAAFRQLPQPLHVLVLAEDWCADVVDNLPILGQLAQQSGKLDLRIFLRDQHPDLMDQYLSQGQFRSIPVFAFFDDQFHEIGRFIERPASVTARRDATKRQLYVEHPEFGSPDVPVGQLPEDLRLQVITATKAAREALKPIERQEVIHDLRATIEQVPH